MGLTPLRSRLQAAMQDVERATHATTFEADYKAAAQGLRAAFTGLLTSAGADPSNSRELARRFGLNKNLTWKVAKIVTGSDPFAAAQHIPGPNGVEILLKAMRKGGASASAVQEARVAMRDFERVVEVHTGDRATLELMLADLASRPTRAEHLLQNRKLAFQGNSGTFGVRAKAQIGVSIIAPSETPGLVDLVQCGGVVGLRRLRQDARWLLFRRAAFTDDGSRVGPAIGEAIDPDFANGMPLIRAFCSTPLPEVNVLETETEFQYELPPGPVGNQASINIVYGVMMRATAPAFRDEHDDMAELFCSTSTPAELLQFDVVLHEDFDWAMRLEPALFSRMDGGPMHASSGRERNRLPFTETVQELGRGVATMASPHIAWQTSLVQDVFDRLGWDADRFHAFRLTIPYPPIPAMAMLRAPLPERPA